MSENIAHIEVASWNTIECLLRRILSGDNLNEEECDQFSKSVRSFCGKRTIKALTLPRCMRLYSTLRSFLKKHIESLRTIALKLTGSELLTFYQESWVRYSEALQCINKHFNYASRLCFDSLEFPRGDGFYQVGLYAWRSGLFEVCRKELIRNILAEIAKDRGGGEVSKMQLSTIINSIIADNDKSYFESEFLTNSLEFYATQNFKLPTPLTAPDYIKWAESTIQKEIKRHRAYLEESTLKNLANIVSKKLLDEDAKEILSKEFLNLLNEEKVEELSNLTEFLVKYENDLTNLVVIFESYVYSLGSRGLSQVCKEAQSSPKIYVEAIDALLSRCDYLLQNAFGRNPSFTRAANKACERIINANAITESLGGSHKSPEILAKYSDLQLRRHSKTAGNVVEGLQIVMKVFPFVIDKVTFQKTYESLLARRLVGNRSISEDFERCMINFLAEKCGDLYVTTFNQMLADMKSSQELSKEYCKWLERSNETSVPGSLSTTIVVLRSFRWPFQPDYDLTVPFEVSAYQMAILMLFNKAEIYTVRQMEALTNIDEVRLVPLLESLLKTQILEFVIDGVSKSADNEEIEVKGQKAEAYSQAAELSQNLPTVTMDTKLTLCKKYYNDQIYVNLNLPVRFVNEEVKKKKMTMEVNAERVESGRIISIQCYIIRLLKARRRMAHQDLVKGISEQPFIAFQPSTTQIKLSLDKLIERGFIRRDPDDMTTFEYIT
nr:cullin 1 [Hymenolepis microstoma]